MLPRTFTYKYDGRSDREVSKLHIQLAPTLATCNAETYHSLLGHSPSTLHQNASPSRARQKTNTEEQRVSIRRPSAAGLAKS